MAWSLSVTSKSTSPIHSSEEVLGPNKETPYLRIQITQQLCYYSAQENLVNKLVSLNVLQLQYFFYAQYTCQ